MTQSPEPLEGITDAVFAAEWFAVYARAHLDRPYSDEYRKLAAHWASMLSAKLQALK